MRVGFIIIALGLLPGIGAGAEPANSGESLLILAGRVIDPQSGTISSDQAIVVSAGRVSWIGAAASIQTDHAQVIDLGDSTVLPGLIDAHTHITNGDPGDYINDRLRRSPIDRAVSAHIFARRTLEAGFTTVRDLGAKEYVDVALRKAIDSGLVAGPRMLVAGLSIGATGGHVDIVGFSPYLRFNQMSNIADGPDEIRKLVRLNVKNGADVIKMIATAGVLSEEESVGAPQFSQEEMNVLVEEANRWGRRVAAHAHGTEGIKMAIRAGVASIEHGSLLDDEAIRMMKKRGTYLVADVYDDDYILAEFARLGYPEMIIEKERKVGRIQRENFRRAVRAGVKIAYGTDAGVYPHGWNGKQFAKMVEWGTTPMQALQAATVNAADLLGKAGSIGVIAPGAYADIIAVMGDPLEDISVMEHIAFVMKGGIVYKDTLTRGSDHAVGTTGTR